MSAVLKEAAGSTGELWGEALLQRYRSDASDLWKQLQGLDWSLLVLCVMLISVGMIMVASASVSFAESVYGDQWFFVKRHLKFLLLGLAGAAVVTLLPTWIWRQYGTLLLILAIALLIAVLIPGLGKKVNGSQRWLQLGLFSLQASELAKFCVVVFFADYLSRKQHEVVVGWKGFLKCLGIMVALVVLLLLEPDFGSSVVLVATIMGMMFLAGVRLSQFTLLMAGGIGSLAALAWLSPYRVKRLVTFLDPWADQFNSGYQLTQSLIAFGRGEWLGVGLGNSVQKLLFLPEAHTDFVVSILAEEFGLLGIVIVVTMFILLALKIFKISRNAIRKEDYFTGFFAFGMATLFSAQAFINVGVASGFLPTKGLTLPFLSYGGSSLIVSCMFMGLLIRLDCQLRTSK